MVSVSIIIMGYQRIFWMTNVLLINKSYHFIQLVLPHYLIKTFFMQNRININITAADETAINNALTSLVNTLSPYLQTLTDEERKGGLKMGIKDISFIDKANSYGSQFNQVIPSYVSLTNLQVDVAAVNKLNSILRPLATLVRSIEDSIMLSGSEAMEAALLVYAALKGAAQNNINGTPEAVNDMAERFPSKLRKPKTTVAK
jgi:hypothetical protein